jgi:hypothetical protein
MEGYDELDGVLQHASKSPITFAESLLINPYTKDQFIPNYIQRKFMSSGQKNVWFAVSRRTGKCIAGNNFVLHPETLRPTPIKDLAEVNRTWVFDFNESKIVESSCNWVYSGSKPCIKFTLRTGNTLTISQDHLVFDSKRGWVRAIDIKLGDRILAPDDIPVFGDLSVSDQDCEAYAGLVLLQRHLPDPIFRMNKESLRTFIRKYWELNGRYWKQKEAIILLTDNKPLASDFHHLLLRFGIETYIDVDHRLFITDDIDKSLFLNLVGVEVPILEIKSDRRWEMVLDIKNIGNQPVYDLCVDHPDHNFLANNIVVHNSFGMVVTALFYALFEENKNILIFAPSQVQINEIFDNIDLFIETNHFLQAMKSPTGNFKNPQQRRSFTTGTKISGYPLGLTDGLQKARRGLTGDVIFIDEAQDLQEGDWTVLQPIMVGDKSRRGKIKNYIAGTIVEPVGKFYDMIFHPPAGHQKTSEIIYIPIDQNPDYSPEEIESMRIEVADEGKWMTEYLLRPYQVDTAVFKKEDVDYARAFDWDYGIENISNDLPRFLTIDWDKMQAGTNIMVTQYNPNTGVLRVIDREEVPRSDFTYMDACGKAIDYFMAYDPELVIADQGMGEVQWEYLFLKSEEMGLSLHERLMKVSLSSKIEVKDVSTGEPTKKRIKPFIVGLMQTKFQNKQIQIPEHDTVLANQFYMYKVARQTQNTIVYTTRNEHLVDCLGFATYGVYLQYENFLEGNGKPFREITRVESIYNNSIPFNPKEIKNSSDLWEYPDRLPLIDKSLRRSGF